MKDYDVLINPLTTEKSVRLMESQNKLVFVVSPKSTKLEVKKAVETMFNVKVEKVNTQIQKGRKVALITLGADFSAMDIATKLGIL
ncbi:50S ribosomal protein L23 [Candidatus Tiddalikarchaeum anstoanum]|nr:50S ribosomal protein L23 [Candidatus Tiddalikarchaeum anstoanum]